MAERLLPRIAVTMGDPAGVGPELCLRALASDEVRSHCLPVVFGDASVLEAAARATGQAPPSRRLSPREWEEQWATIDAPCVVDLKAIRMTDFQPGTIDARTGAASFKYVNAAIDAARKLVGGRFDHQSANPSKRRSPRRYKETAANSAITPRQVMTSGKR